MPKAFEGANLDPTAVDTWIFQMELYFRTEQRIPAAQHAMIACTNLAGDAALWLQTANVDFD